MAIRRNISVLNLGLIADINIVYGSNLVPIEFYITDYVLPDNAIATLYCTTSDKKSFKCVGTIVNNVISFNPENGFFTVGKNILQIRITADEKNLYTFETGVNCKSRMETNDAQEIKSQPTLIDQLLTQVGNVNGELTKQQKELNTVKDNLDKTKTQDTASNIVTFTNYDEEESEDKPLEWTDVEILISGEKHSSILTKISAMFKNIRYLFKLIGTTDISTIGKGTVTDGIVTLNSKLQFSSMNTGCIALSLYNSQWLKGVETLDKEYSDNAKIFTSIHYIDGTALTHANYPTLSAKVEGNTLTIWASGSFLEGHYIEVEYLIVE